MPQDIRVFTADHIDPLVSAFSSAHWAKPRSTFEQYLSEQENGKRMLWVAFDDNQFAGYVTLKWKSLYPPFLENDIPEIMDLNVLPASRGKGFGSALLQIAEDTAFRKSPVVGLGVGLYPDYGVAQKLYITHGYIPDLRGITYDYEPVKPGANVRLDDDLILWFTKKKPE